MGHRENPKTFDLEPTPTAHVPIQPGIRPGGLSNPNPTPVPTPAPTPTRMRGPLQAGIRPNRVSERRQFGMDVRRMIKMVQKAVLNPGGSLRWSTRKWLTDKILKCIFHGTSRSMHQNSYLHRPEFEVKTN